MTKQELNQWYTLLEGELVCKQLGFNPPQDEHLELIRLNHLVMEMSHEVHNNNMLLKG